MASVAWLEEVLESAWAKIIAVESTLNKFGKKIDHNNILQLYPGWQPLQSNAQVQTPQSDRLQINDLPKIDKLGSQNQLLPVSIPQAQGIKPQDQFLGHTPQTKIIKILNQEKLETQLPLNVPLDDNFPLEEQTEELSPQSQALQGLTPAQYYQLLQQLNPYQDPRSFQPASNKPNYYQSSNLGPNIILPTQNKPSYYQTPDLNIEDLSQEFNPNINTYQQANNIPLQILAAPKKASWNPASNHVLIYEGDIENRHKINQKKAKIDYKLKNTNVNKEKNQVNSKEKPKNKNKLKNNVKESSDQLATVTTKGAKNSKENNDWVPIVRTVPKHYKFEKNNSESKEKVKHKNKSKGEPVEKVTKPNHYIFEKGSLVKQFKKNKFLERKPLEEEFMEQPKKSIKHKSAKEKPVHEFLEPESEPDTYEKERQILESQTSIIKPKTHKPKHKKPSPKDQINSESYLNHKGANDNFQHENVNEFNGNLNGTQSHGAASPPANKDRTMFHMVGHDGPMSYKWGFDTGAGEHRQYRFEERDKEGIVKGQFGYLDDKGKFRKMNYNAHPVHGFSMEPADGTFDDLKQ